MTEDELNVRNFFARLAAEPTDDKEFTLREDVACSEAAITEIHILRRAKPHQPGQPCLVSYLRSTQKCDNYSDTDACKNTDCKYNRANQEYFKKLQELQKFQESEKTL